MTEKNGRRLLLETQFVGVIVLQSNYQEYRTLLRDVQPSATMGDFPAKFYNTALESKILKEMCVGSIDFKKILGRRHTDSDYRTLVMAIKGTKAVPVWVVGLRFRQKYDYLKALRIVNLNFRRSSSDSSVTDTYGMTEVDFTLDEPPNQLNIWTKDKAPMPPRQKSALVRFAGDTGQSNQTQEVESMDNLVPKVRIKRQDDKARKIKAIQSTLVDPNGNETVSPGEEGIIDKFLTIFRPKPENLDANINLSKGHAEETPKPFSVSMQQNYILPNIFKPKQEIKISIGEDLSPNESLVTKLSKFRLASISKENTNKVNEVGNDNANYLKTEVGSSNGEEILIFQSPADILEKRPRLPDTTSKLFIGKIEKEKENVKKDETKEDEEALEILSTEMAKGKQSKSNSFFDIFKPKRERESLDDGTPIVTQVSLEKLESFEVDNPKNEKPNETIAAEKNEIENRRYSDIKALSPESKQIHNSQLEADGQAKRFILHDFIIQMFAGGNNVEKNSAEKFETKDHKPTAKIPDTEIRTDKQSNKNELGISSTQKQVHESLKDKVPTISESLSQKLKKFGFVSMSKRKDGSLLPRGKKFDAKSRSFDTESPPPPPQDIKQLPNSLSDTENNKKRSDAFDFITGLFASKKNRESENVETNKAEKTHVPVKTLDAVIPTDEQNKAKNFLNIFKQKQNHETADLEAPNNSKFSFSTPGKFGFKSTEDEEQNGIVPPEEKYNGKRKSSKNKEPSPEAKEVPHSQVDAVGNGKILSSASPNLKDKNENSRDSSTESAFLEVQNKITNFFTDWLAETNDKKDDPKDVPVPFTCFDSPFETKPDSGLKNKNASEKK